MNAPQFRTCGCGAPGDFSRGMCSHCYTSTRYKQQILGSWDPDRLDPAAARAHLEQLRAAGLNQNQVARLAGVHHTVLSRLPEVAFITRRTEQALLAIPVPEHCAEIAPDKSLVPITGSVRRIQALVAFGYPQAQLSRELGIQVASMRALTGRPVPGNKSAGQEITAGRHRQIEKLFNQLQMTPGPSQGARELGKKHGWALPFEWDEESIDHPDAKPIRAQRTPKTDREARQVERRELIATEVRQGATGHLIADRHKLAPAVVDRIISELGGAAALRQAGDNAGSPRQSRPADTTGTRAVIEQARRDIAGRRSPARTRGLERTR
ncbi:hypothetical protein [Nocardia sp. XZ_19_385]|uniref:hypothetical protein n=1 Tax=Nocardia sp. XZ_19_385 TaxID=2769488 RepID=UPI00188FD8F2|nr:hypothetical protein [Nocardia sp. XZ_19_385]